MREHDFLDAIIGYHALTGCDTISVFSGKWKPLPLLVKNNNYGKALTGPERAMSFNSDCEATVS